MRVAATVFTAGLPAAFVGYFVDPTARATIPLLRVALTGIAIALIGVALLLVPWDRLPSRAILLIAPLSTLCAIAGDMADHYLRHSTIGLTITLIVLPLWIGLTGQRGMALLLGTACDATLLAYAQNVLERPPTAQLVVAAGAAIIMAEVFCKQTARADLHLRSLSALAAGFRADMRHPTAWRKQIEQLAHSVLPQARVRLWWAGELHGSKIDEFVSDRELREALTEAMTTRELVVFDDAIIVALPSTAAQVHGVLVLEFASSPDEFTYPVIELLGAQVGAKLDALREADGLRKSSHTDPLTKVGNRRGPTTHPTNTSRATLSSSAISITQASQRLVRPPSRRHLCQVRQPSEDHLRGSDAALATAARVRRGVEAPRPTELIANRLLQALREQNPITTPLSERRAPRCRSSADNARARGRSALSRQERRTRPVSLAPRAPPRDRRSRRRLPWAVVVTCHVLSCHVSSFTRRSSRPDRPLSVALSILSADS